MGAGRVEVVVVWDFHILPSESIIKVMRSVITSSRRLKLVNRLGWLAG